MAMENSGIGDPQKSGRLAAGIRFKHFFIQVCIFLTRMSTLPPFMPSLFILFRVHSYYVAIKGHGCEDYE